MAEELRDILNDLPPELNDDSSGGTTTTTVVADDTGDDQADEDNTSEDADTADDTETAEEGETETDNDDQADETAEDDQAEYIVDNEEEASATATTTDKPQTQDEFILAGLQKLTVRVIGPDDKIHTVQAYGNGDLPRDMKAFATKYEEKVWDTQVVGQEQKARELRDQFQTKQREADTETFVRRENMAIRDDLNDLIKEGVFPKFKGTPGSREFEDSAGGKEFDRVIAFMHEQNQAYSAAANKGRAYRHIGFHEAFTMLHGPNPKAAERAEDTARKKIATKLKSSGGITANKRNVSSKPVAKLVDLESEFAAFSGSTA